MIIGGIEMAIKTEKFRAKDITKDGKWIIDDRKVELAGIKLHLPGNYGKREVLMFFNDASVYHKRCFSCNEKTSHEQSIIVMEDYHYMVAHCCNKIQLFDNKELVTRSLL